MLGTRRAVNAHQSFWWRMARCAVRGAERSARRRKNAIVENNVTKEPLAFLKWCSPMEAQSVVWL